MIQQALTILDDLIGVRRSRENRTTNLLKDPSTESGDGWYMCVPPCFNDALDIKRTERVENGRKVLVWTQGSWFSFKRVILSTILLMLTRFGPMLLRVSMFAFRSRWHAARNPQTAFLIGLLAP